MSPPTDLRPGQTRPLGFCGENHTSLTDSADAVTKSLRYFLWGILADAALLAGVSLYMVGSVLYSYNGRCGVFFFFGGEGHPCSRWEYLKEETAFVTLGLLDAKEVWVPALLFLTVLPMFGYLLGRTTFRKMS